MPIFYNTASPTPTTKNTINDIAVGYGIRDFLLNLNLQPQYPQIPTNLNGSPRIGEPVLDTTVGTGNVLIPIGLPLATNGIIWKDLNVINNTFQNDPNVANILEQIDYIPAIPNPDFTGAIWPTNSQYPTGANPQVEQYGIKGKTETAQYRQDNVTRNLYLDSTSQIDMADFIGLQPLDISQQLGNYLDVFGGINQGGAAGDQALNVIGSVLNGQGVGLGAGGSVIPNFDFKSSLAGRVLGATGFVKDTKLGNVGAQQLTLALANNAAFNVQQEILGALNVRENIYSLIKDGELAGFRPNYKITVPSSTGGQILNGVTRVLGFQIPRSYLDDAGSIFQTENGDAGNINRANSMIENTGKGQVKSLIELMLQNISVNSVTQNPFRSGYAPAFNDKNGEPISDVKLYAYYSSSGEGTTNGDINKILGNVGDVIPSISYNREAETENSNFFDPILSSNNILFKGYENRTPNDVTFSWVSEPLGELVNAVGDGRDRQLLGDKKSLLVKTQKLFNNKGMKTIVSVKGDMNKASSQIQTANGYGFSKGSAVMTSDMFNLETGTWNGEKDKTADETYCRSWTTFNRYDSIQKLIRKKALYNDPEAPYRFQTEGSVLDGPFVKIAPYAGEDSQSTDPKKYMFSIENLAWKDNVEELPPCEIGPGDLTTEKNKGRIMWFPPYDIQFSENSSVNWEETNFIGRGEPIYTYNNTKRSGQLSFKIIVDHPSYYNAFRAKIGQNGPDDNYIASFFAGCIDIDERWSDKLTKTQRDLIESITLDIPQAKQNPVDPPIPNPIKVYYPNDVKEYVPTYENGKCVTQTGTTDVDYLLNPAGLGCGLGTYKADITKEDVGGKTLEWPDPTDYGLNIGRLGEEVIINGQKINGYNDPNYATVMVEFLKTYPWAVVNFTGYASPQGNLQSNTKLANLRATLLRDKLIKDWGSQLGVADDILQKRFVVKDGIPLTQVPGCIKETPENPNPPVFFEACKTSRRVEISVTYDTNLKAEYEKAIAPKPKTVEIARTTIRTEIVNKFYTECDYFERMMADYEDENGNIVPGNKFIFDSIREKIKYFHPAFHSTTPEGLNSRLTFLLQCTRQGPTLEKQGANNLAFGRAPICILRIGDFYHTKIVIDNINISYEPLVWDLNPEGVGVQPMIANVDMSFSFIGGSSLNGPISKLQNSLSFNYFANTHVYDPRADYIAKNDLINNNNNTQQTTTAQENQKAIPSPYKIIDGISYAEYKTNNQEKTTILNTETFDIEDNQIADEEFTNDGLIIDEEKFTGFTNTIILTEMTCNQDGIVKTDTHWLLPIKITYAPAMEASEAVTKIEGGVGNYKIRVKDANSNEMTEYFLLESDFINFFTLNDSSDNSKFKIKIKRGGSDNQFDSFASNEGIIDSIGSENFILSLVYSKSTSEISELFKLNIKL